MVTQELYIRNENETEARGPFSVPQVADLAETGQVTPATLFYDANVEQWVAIEANAELKAQIFPEKKKLSLKTKEIKPLNKPEENAKEISVHDMLDAAEGRTEDTKGKADPEIAMMQAARIGMYGGLLSLIAAAAAELLPSTAALISMDPKQLMAQPLVFLGLLDLALAALLGLGMFTIYPFVRFRAALGAGLLGFIFYTQGASLPLLYVLVGSVGLYLCTVFVSVGPAVIAALAGVGGMGALAFYMLSS